MDADGIAGKEHVIHAIIHAIKSLIVTRIFQRI